MSPRGVAIPGLREHLFDAAERIVARDGAAALTSRAVTTEAGCAKGVLHARFAGLDEFVAELVLDRFSRSAAVAAGLPARAGTGTVAENLGTVAAAILSLDPGVVGLSLTRPGAARHVRDAWQSGAPGFGSVQGSVETYLGAERTRGRVPPSLDPETVALALVGTLHHLLMTGSLTSGPSHPRVDRLIHTLLAAP
ncbi:TetR/AcrR family transcriptional regulator [Streptomyces sp. NPDC001985]|uniref:TetR/AcrR family transcriptional regulator n=1 Tax=Streptomyces sp. NPDC001985 TaxID=3154406 RepID=UPI003321C2C7